MDVNEDEVLVELLLSRKCNCGDYFSDIEVEDKENYRGVFMKNKSNRYLWFFLIPTIIGLGIYQHYFSQTPLSPQELVIKQLTVSAMSPDSAWDTGYLANNPLIKKKIEQFENGTLCRSLKHLNTKALSHPEILKQLRALGYTCVVRPLSENPSAASLRYLKKDNTTTQDPNEKGVAHQEICQDQAQLACVIRIKRDGFPQNKRSAPHSSKALLMDEKGDPGSYDNEAFKIGGLGQPLPKGPSQKFGLKRCPYYEDKKSCDRWVDALMEEAHPSLKEPQSR